MWGLEKQQKYWLCSGNMRRCFDSLSGLIRSEMKEYDPLSGEMFVFLNRRRMQMKIWYGKAVDSCYTTSGWNQGCLSNRR